MPEYEFEMRAVMKALNASGALPHCIVTGSWAMYVLNHQSLPSSYNCSLSTKGSFYYSFAKVSVNQYNVSKTFINLLFCYYMDKAQ